MTHFSEEHEMFRKTLREFVEHEIEPHADAMRPQRRIRLRHRGFEHLFDPVDANLERVGPGLFGARIAGLLTPGQERFADVRHARAPLFLNK